MVLAYITLKDLKADSNIIKIAHMQFMQSNAAMGCAHGLHFLQTAPEALMHPLPSLPRQHSEVAQRGRHSGPRCGCPGWGGLDAADMVGGRPQSFFQCNR